jgi:ATP-dependent RNA helicase DHX36
MLEKMKGQFMEILNEIGFVGVRNPTDLSVNHNSSKSKSALHALASIFSPADNEKMVRAVLCAGLYPNVAKIIPDMAPPGSK